MMTIDQTNMSIGKAKAVLEAAKEISEIYAITLNDAVYQLCSIIETLFDIRNEEETTEDEYNKALARIERLESQLNAIYVSCCLCSPIARQVLKETE